MIRNLGGYLFRIRFGVDLDGQRYLASFNFERHTLHNFLHLATSSDADAVLEALVASTSGQIHIASALRNVSFDVKLRDDSGESMGRSVPLQVVRVSL